MKHWTRGLGLTANDMGSDWNSWMDCSHWYDFPYSTSQKFVNLIALWHCLIAISIRRTYVWNIHRNDLFFNWLLKMKAKRIFQLFWLDRFSNSLQCISNEKAWRELFCLRFNSQETVFFCEPQWKVGGRLIYLTGVFLTHRNLRNDKNPLVMCACSENTTWTLPKSLTSSVSQ